MAAPGDRLWLAVSKSMGGGLARLCGGRRYGDCGAWMWGTNRRVPDPPCSTHDKATFVEEEAHAVYEHLYRKRLFAVHEVADQDEEQNEDVQMEW